MRKSKPAKPPESRSEADKSISWRTSATAGSETGAESDDDEEEDSLPEITKQRKVRIAEVAQGGETERDDGSTTLPYREVPIVDRRSIEKSKNQHSHLSKEAASKREERAYRVRAPVQVDGLGKKLSNQLLDTDITLKMRDLLGVAPDVRDESRVEITKVRQPVPLKVRQELAQINEELALPFTLDEGPLRLEYDALSMNDLPQISSVYITTAAGEYPAGSIMVPDPYMQYLETLGPDEAPKQVYVARDSASLRVIHPSVNKEGIVECVTDSGSQIVSMSLEQAQKSKLGWDPDVQIIMQSANGSLEKSVGLAKNIPFKFGDMTVYLQVHIIKGPAYKALLGRPFEILTESTVQNNSDGSQTITLKCPNTGKRVTIPTFARGKHEDSAKPRKATIESVLDERDGHTRTADPATGESGFHQSSMN